MSIISILMMALTAFAIGVLGRVNEARDDNLHCGVFATGDAQNLHELAWDAMYGTDVKEGDATNKHPKPRTDTFTVPGRGCKRVGCWNTSGLYLCNDHAEARDFKYFDVGDTVIHQIIRHCCTLSQHWISSRRAVSGQMFFGDYNIGIGYSNCNKGDDYRPGDYEYPGVNGWCM